MKTKQKSSGLGFKMTLLAVGCIPMMLGIVILAIVLTSNMKGEIITGIENELQIAAGQVKQFFTAELKEKGTVDYNAYADHEYIESLQGHGVELTLFQGDTRLITSLKKDDGTYNEGTAASPEIYATIHSGKDRMLSLQVILIMYIIVRFMMDRAASGECLLQVSEKSELPPQLQAQLLRL